MCIAVTSITQRCCYAARAVDAGIPPVHLGFRNVPVQVLVERLKKECKNLVKKRFVEITPSLPSNLFPGSRKR